MPLYDFEDNEYRPMRDIEQRALLRKSFGIEQEWTIRESKSEHGSIRLRLCSATHDDDVELELSGNFTNAQRDRVAAEICAQLNKAENDATREFT